MGMLGVRLMVLAERLAPLCVTPARKVSITSLDPRMHEGEMNTARERLGLPIDLGSSDDHEHGLGTGGTPRLVKRCHLDAIDGSKLRRSAQHEIASLRQCLADGLVGFAAHQYVPA